MNINDWEKAFARNFLILRQENGLTQKQMAEKLNISVYMPYKKLSMELFRRDLVRMC